MKLKKLGEILKKSKRAVIFQKQTESGFVVQYLSDGSGIYPCFGLPRLTKEGLLTILDIEKSKWDGWHVSEKEIPEDICLSDTDDVEWNAFPTFYNIDLGNRVVTPLETELNGIVFLDIKYLTPLQDTPGLQFFIRKSRGGELYIAVKNGVLLVAVIMPVRVVCGAFLEKSREFMARITTELVRGNLPKEIVIDMDQLDLEENGEEN